MTHWDERFKNHDVFGALETVENRLQNVENAALTSVEAREAHARLEHVVAHVNSLLSAADPHLTPKKVLDRTATSLAEVANHLRNFKNSENVNELTVNANEAADTALEATQLLSVPAKLEDVEGLRQDVTRFRQSAAAHLRNLEKDARQAKEKIAEDFKSVQASVAKTESQIEVRLQELNTEKQRLDKAISQFQEQFSKTEDQRASKFTESTESRAEAWRALMSDSEKALQSEVSRLKEEAQTFLEHFERRKEEVEELVGATGAAGLTGGFKQAASEERAAANRWRIVGVGGILAVAAVTIFMFDSLTEGIVWGSMAGKALVSAPFAALAGYALTESAKHRRRQARNRRLALELASINPYLALMPTDDQYEVKKRLVERWFAQPDAAGGDEEVSKKNLLEVIHEAIKVMGAKG